MAKYNCDLHYHSPYAAACSKNITIPLLAQEARKKGLDVLTTADILHPLWLEHVKENLIEKEGCFRYKEIIKGKKIYFILGTEVETEKRVHHLLYFKNYEQIEDFKREIKDFCQDMTVYGSGRTKLKTTAENLLNICKKLGMLIGPAHVFTPYFGVYAHFDSLKEAYGDNWKYIKFIELGLSADTSLANKIPELKDSYFFSFSDSHSPMSYRIGREYISVEMKKPNFSSLKNLLERKEGKLLFNVGYNPREGKYGLTACSKCYQHYTLKQAIENKWKCLTCKKSIKKGVLERTEELAIDQNNLSLKQINKRPDYKYLIPLAQVIQIAIGQKNINHKKVIELYDKFIDKYTEIEIMQETSFEELKEIDLNIAKYIISFRKNLVVFYPGGGGNYGTPFIYFNKEEKDKKEKEISESLYLKDTQTKLF